MPGRRVPGATAVCREASEVSGFSIWLAIYQEYFGKKQISGRSLIEQADCMKDEKPRLTAVRAPRADNYLTLFLLISPIADYRTLLNSLSQFSGPLNSTRRLLNLEQGLGYIVYAVLMKLQRVPKCGQ